MPHGRIAIDGPARATRVAYHDALMEKDSGLTKGEREMIVVATTPKGQERKTCKRHQVVVSTAHGLGPVLLEVAGMGHGIENALPQIKSKLISFFKLPFVIPEGLE